MKLITIVTVSKTVLLMLISSMLLYSTDLSFLSPQDSSGKFSKEELTLGHSHLYQPMNSSAVMHSNKDDSESPSSISLL